MKVLSAAVARAIEIVGLEGNDIASLSGGFSKQRQFIFMRQPLSPGSMSAIARDLPQLRHYRTERTPHNPADEGFADDECSVVISFPIEAETSRWT